MFRPIRFALAQLLALGLAAPLAAQPPAEKKAEKKADAATMAKLRVTMPEDDAELMIMGKATKQTGLKREFDIPQLDVGKKYEYELVAKWRPNNYTVMTRKKIVPFEAGSDIAVDLTVDDPKDRAEIRYVPTPEDVVARMIKLADIKKDDVVFEPGCGDARIVVAAVKAGAKRGVGIDLDPERIKESKATVEVAGVDAKVDIRQADALDIKDFSDATVVFLYMGDEFNALIRPILWKSLKVGTRIVSHRFTMGDWKPDQTVKMNGEDGDEYELHLWTVTEAIKKRLAEKPAEVKPAKDDQFVGEPVMAMLQSPSQKREVEAKKEKEAKKKADEKKKAEEEAKKKKAAKRKAEDAKKKKAKSKKPAEKPPVAA